MGLGSLEVHWVMGSLGLSWHYTIKTKHFMMNKNFLADFSQIDCLLLSLQSLNLSSLSCGVHHSQYQGSFDSISIRIKVNYVTKPIQSWENIFLSVGSCVKSSRFASKGLLNDELIVGAYSSNHVTRNQRIKNYFPCPCGICSFFCFCSLTNQINSKPNRIHFIIITTQ